MGRASHKEASVAENKNNLLPSIPVLCPEDPFVKPFEL